MSMVGEYIWVCDCCGAHGNASVDAYMAGHHAVHLCDECGKFQKRYQRAPTP
jgi:ribosomal protein L37AE/L43A